MKSILVAMTLLAGACCRPPSPVALHRKACVDRAPAPRPPPPEIDWGRQCPAGIEVCLTPEEAAGLATYIVGLQRTARWAAQTWTLCGKETPR